MPKSINTEDFLNYIKENTNNDYKLLSEYTRGHDKVLMLHKTCGNKYMVTPTKFKQGRRCPYCCKNNKLKSINDFKQDVYNLYKDEYEVIGEYINTSTPIQMKHTICGNENYFPVPRDFLLGKTHCKCNVENKHNQSIVKKFNEVSKGNYTLLSHPIKLTDEITVRHKLCGNTFKIKYASSFINDKCGCRFCKGSKEEHEIYEFIKSFYNKMILTNDRTILPNNQELDIYLPEDKIAIEFNGTYWHSVELLGDSSYHANKTKECEKLGIRLIHIFETDWITQKDLIKKKIKYILNSSNDLKRVYARNCKIRHIELEDKNDFLNKNHIQGADTSGTILLGLYNNDDLVAVMTFFLRNKKNSDTIYELSRYAADNDYIIVGGFSKILSYFKKNYIWSEIYSFADKTWSIGNLYKINGFKYEYTAKPSYKYYRYDKPNELQNKRKFRKDKIKRNYPEVYDENKTETEMMRELGYYRIYDCGLDLYIMKNN